MSVSPSPSRSAGASDHSDPSPVKTRRVGIRTGGRSQPSASCSSTWRWKFIGSSPNDSVAAIRSLRPSPVTSAIRTASGLDPSGYPWPVESCVSVTLGTLRLKPMS